MNDLMKGLLLCLLTLPTGLFAQCPYPILQCEVSDPIGHPNRVSCQLQWALSPEQATSPQSDSCFTPIPLAPIPTPGPQDELGIVDDAIRPPRWIFSWDLGNGHYLADTTDQITYEYAAAGDYHISVQARSIYSPDEDPTEEDLSDPDAKRIELVTAGAPPNNLATPNNSNFAPADNQQLKEVKITPQIRAAQPGDQLTIALSIRRFDNGSSATGALFISLPQGTAQLVNNTAQLDSRFGPNVPLTQVANDEVELYRIDYENLSGERTYFLTLAVDGETEADHLELEAALISDYQNSQDALGFFGLGGKSTPGGAPQGGGNLIPNPGYIPSSNQGDSIHLRVNNSRDPNAIICDATVEPGQSKTLSCRIDFENLGEGNAREVIAQSHLAPQLDPKSVQSGLLFPTENQVNVTKAEAVLAQAPNGPLVWQFDTTGTGLKYVLATPFTAPQANRGFVHYDITTKANLNLVDGDTIHHRALILMDGDSLWTDPFPTLVRAPQRIRLPWHWGIRLGAQAQEGGDEQVDWSGFHLGLTLRKALRKMDAQLRNRPFLRPSDLPEWYFLGELTLLAFQQFDDAQGLEQRQWNSDLVPGLMYTPRALRGRLALHGGGFGGLRWLVQTNGDNRDLMDNDRWEYGWYAGLSVGNNIGRPGVNLGGRVYRRYGELGGQSQDYYLYQLYLHFTF
ncbi:MAG: hypothetical protein AAFW73_12775 [Bacteroidota bacterium]